MKVLGVIVLTLVISLAHGADPFCPETINIAPCYCFSTNGVPSVHCQYITDQDQLETIFDADFPVRDFEEFLLIDSQITTMDRNIFGNSSFQKITLEGKFLDTITVDVYIQSVNTLTNLNVDMCPITSTSFPFAEAAAFTNILEFKYDDNLITNFPPLISDTAKIGFLTNNYIQVIPRGALSSLPALESMSLSGNQINSIELGAFQGAENLRSLLLGNNKLTSLSASFFTNLPSLIYLTLNNNEISTIEEGTFHDLYALKTLHLQYNKLTQLNSTTIGENSQLEKFDAKHNQIENIEPGLFAETPAVNLVDISANNLTRILAGTFDGLSKVSIYLSQNNINYIESNAFGGIENSTVHLENNVLTNLFEFWMSPLLEAGNEIYVANNPYGCGCEIAWIFNDPSFQSRIYGQCPDGTYISDLNADDYAACSNLRRNK